jgi:hypothetical protein
MEQLSKIPLFEDSRYLAVASHPQLLDSSQARRLLYESIWLMLSAQVSNVIQTTQLGIDRIRPKNVDEVTPAAPSVAANAAIHAKTRDAGAVRSKRCLPSTWHQHAGREGNPGPVDCPDRGCQILAAGCHRAQEPGCAGHLHRLHAWPQGLPRCH